MKNFVRHVLENSDFPDWVKPNNEMLNIIKIDSQDMLPWSFVDKESVSAVNIFICHTYNTRTLFCFAYREDSNAIACFEKTKPGKVVIVYNDDEPGFEAGPEFISFEAWYNYTLNVDNGDHDYDNIPGIDYYPYG